jgi:hypothetical protein
MSDPVRIRYVWNEENIEKLFASSYQYVFTHSARRYVGWLFIALLQFGVVAALKQNAVGLLMFSSIMLVYWYYGKKIIAHRRAIASFEASPFKDQEIRIDADEDGLEIHSHEGGAQWAWDEIDSVVGLGDDILLYKAPHSHYVPSGGFTSIEAKSQFKSLAKKHGKLA